MEKPRPIEVTKEMPPDWQKVRKEMLKQIPSKTEGLNIGRIKEFFDSFPGLTTTDYLVFDEDDLPKIRGFLEPRKMLSKDSFGKGEPLHGCFINGIDLSLVERRRDFETANGALFTEHILVHELAHSSGEHAQYVQTGPHAYYRPRAGFALSRLSRGSFLEEGFAEMMAGQYIERSMTKEEREKLLEEFGMGASFSLDATATVNDLETHYDHPLPMKYIFKNPQGGDSATIPARAAFGLELLCKRSDELYPLLLSARHDIESLRDVAKNINSIKPNLYSILQKLQYNRNDFMRGLKHIIDELYGGNLSINERREVEV